MRHLCLGKIPINFSPDKHTAFSISCFLGREKVYADWENLSFSKSMIDVNILNNAESMIGHFAYRYILPGLVDELNALHNTNYSFDFWCFLLNPWLFTTLTLSWINYIQLANFIDRSQPERFLVELISQDSWKFSDTQDYINNGFLNIQYHHWILSEFLQKIAPSDWELYDGKPKDTPVDAVAPPLWQGSKIKRLKEEAKDKITNFLMRQRCVDGYGLSILQRLLWSYFLALKPIRPTMQHNLGWKREHLEANDQIQDFFSAEFINSIGIIIKKSIPLCFTKNFFEYDNQARRGRYKAGKIRVISGGFTYIDRLNFQLAHAEQAGERIVFTQHGGGYGYAQMFPLSNETEFRHYAFFSWGWDRHNNYQGNFIPISSPHLSRFVNKYRRENNSLILVGAHLSPLTLRMHSKPLGERLIHCRKDKINFLNNLDKKIIEKTLYRPHEPKGALEDEQYLLEKFGNLSICYGELHAQLLRCKLLVLDHPLTTLNIAMAANVPLVCFWNKQDWVMCEEAVSYFQRLADTGILFSNGREAAGKVNEIWEDIDGWWHQSDLQKARQEWCQQFARAHKQWWREWLQTLWKM